MTPLLTFAQEVAAGAYPEELRERALAALEGADAVQGWRTIDSAPKDGRHVLIANSAPGSVHPREGYYVKPEHRYEEEPKHPGWWRLAGSSEQAIHGRTPTHWQPLPPPPVLPPGEPT